MSIINRGLGLVLALCLAAGSAFAQTETRGPFDSAPGSNAGQLASPAPVVTMPGSGSLGVNNSILYPAACGLVTTLGTTATQVCPVSSNGHRFYLFVQLGVAGGTLACSDDGTTTPVIGGAHTITSVAPTGLYPSIAWGPAFVPAQAIWCIASGSGPITAEQGY